MARPVKEEGATPAPECERYLFFPDCISELIEEREHAWHKDEIDSALKQFPKWDQFVFGRMSQAAQAGRHDIALYCAYHLYDMGMVDSLEHYQLKRNIEEAERDGDTEAVALTYGFAQWARIGIEPRPMDY
jgi:hypothetical protein